jgi:hypothetical protein
VVKGLFFLNRNRDLFQNRYARMSLAYVVRYEHIELSDKQNIPDADGQQEGFYDSIDRIMTKVIISISTILYQQLMFSREFVYLVEFR